MGTTQAVRVARMDSRALLHDVADLAADWLGCLPDRPTSSSRV